MGSYSHYIIPVVAGYVLLSLYLLKNPHILHKKRRPAFRCTHISHRGGAGERIESTMEAFTHAVNEGTDMLELDCHLTHDGFVVVSHDENLLRQTGHDVTISSLNLEDLPPYKKRLEVTFYAGKYSTGEDRKIVLLEDVFKKFPKMPINIEIKEDNRLLMKKVSALVRHYEREDITVWASERSDIMMKCRQENPSMPYMFTASRGLQLLLLYYTGLLPFVPLGESFLQFYLPRVINRYDGHDVFRAKEERNHLTTVISDMFNPQHLRYIPESSILKNGTVIFLIDKITMRKGLLEHLAKRGIQVHLFVCNEEEDIAAAFAVGATGVMTDYPTLLSNYLRAHPHPARHSS